MALSRHIDAISCLRHAHAPLLQQAYILSYRHPSFLQSCVWHMDQSKLGIGILQERMLWLRKVPRNFSGKSMCQSQLSPHCSLSALWEHVSGCHHPTVCVQSGCYANELDGFSVNLIMLKICDLLVRKQDACRMKLCVNELSRTRQSLFDMQPGLVVLHTHSSPGSMPAVAYASKNCTITVYYVRTGAVEPETFHCYTRSAVSPSITSVKDIFKFMIMQLSFSH